PGADIDGPPNEVFDRLDVLALRTDQVSAHFRMRVNEDRLELVLRALPPDGPFDLDTHRLRRQGAAAALTILARLGDQVRDRLAGPLARHLDQPQRADVGDLGPGPIL